MLTLWKSPLSNGMRHDPFRDIDRFFDAFHNDLYARPSRSIGGAAQVDREEDGTTRIVVPLPGLARDDVRIEVSDGQLSIRTETDETSTRGRYVAQFAQSWTLRRDHDIEGITAQMENGVLTVKVPTLEKEVRQIVID
jgi:HSP20 family protein